MIDYFDLFVDLVFFRKGGHTKCHFELFIWQTSLSEN